MKKISSNDARVSLVNLSDGKSAMKGMGFTPFDDDDSIKKQVELLTKDGAAGDYVPALLQELITHRYVVKDSYQLWDTIGSWTMLIRLALANLPIRIDLTAIPVKDLDKVYFRLLEKESKFGSTSEFIGAFKALQSNGLLDEICETEEIWLLLNGRTFRV